MSTKQLLRRARKLYNSEYAPSHINRANQRAWVRAVRALGSRWLLADKRGRLT